MTPTVSVLLPTYNQARFLPECLDALAAQTFRDFEVIAVDDQSDDDTPFILEEHARQLSGWLRHHENEGAANAINSAATLAKGRLLTWVSSDNVMHPDWLATLVGEMRDPWCGAVYSDYYRQDDNVRRPQRPGPYAPDRLISSDACYFGPSFLIRREVWPEHRGGLSHDYDAWLRTEEACWAKGLAIRYVDRVLCTYRVHPEQTGRKHPEKYDAPRWREEAIERRAETSVPSLHR